MPPPLFQLMGYFRRIVFGKRWSRQAPVLVTPRLFAVHRRRSLELVLADPGALQLLREALYISSRWSLALVQHSTALFEHQSLDYPALLAQRFSFYLSPAFSAPTLSFRLFFSRLSVVPCFEHSSVSFLWYSSLASWIRTSTYIG